MIDASQRFLDPKLSTNAMSNRQDYRPPVATNRTAEPRSERARQPTFSQILHLWEAIQQAKSELDHWNEQTSLIEQLFDQHIRPRELSLVSTLCKVSSRLMDCYEQGALASPERALLTLWVNDNLQILHSHPFADDKKRISLQQRWHLIQTEETRCYAEKPTQGYRASQTLTNALDEDDLDEDELLFDFGWHGRSSGNRSSRPTGDRATPNRGSSRKKTPHSDGTTTDSANSRQSSDHSSHIEKYLSIDKLFRQLAKTLHPDREQDETRKQEKHVLMSQCIEARQNKDINTLLTLYCTYIGELPDNLSSEEHRDLIRALRGQLSAVQDAVQRAQHGSTLNRRVVERYAAKHPQQTRRLIEKHAQSLDAEHQQLENVYDALNIHERLLALLDDRRSQEQDRLTINQMTGYYSP